MFLFILNVQASLDRTLFYDKTVILMKFCTYFLEKKQNIKNLKAFYGMKKFVAKVNLSRSFKFLKSTLKFQ